MSGEVLEGAARALGEASSLNEAWRAVDRWAPRFHEALGGRFVRGPRPDLRIDLTRVAGPARGGFTARRGNAFFVGVGSDGGLEKRFTLAHELAHVVLNSGDGLSFELGHDDEERLCDFFARRALAPPVLIREHLERYGYPRRLEDIKGFAARFRITLRGSLVALDEFSPSEWPVAFVAATWRAHPRREGVLGLRVDASASDRRFFVPRDCRLSTLGFPGLEEWVRKAGAGEEGTGVEEKVDMRSRRSGISRWRGSGSWVARRHLAPASSPEEGRGAALCLLDLGALRAAGPKRRRRGVAKPAPAIRIPGQLDLHARAQVGLSQKRQG